MAFILFIIVILIVVVLYALLCMHRTMIHAHKVQSDLLVEIAVACQQNVFYMRQILDEAQTIRTRQR